MHLFHLKPVKLNLVHGLLIFESICFNIVLIVNTAVNSGTHQYQYQYQHPLWKHGSNITFPKGPKSSRNFEVTKGDSVILLTLKRETTLKYSTSSKQFINLTELDLGNSIDIRKSVKAKRSPIVNQGKNSPLSSFTMSHTLLPILAGDSSFEFKFGRDLVHFLIPLKLFHWQYFTVILGKSAEEAGPNSDVKDEGWNWSFNSEDKNFMLMKRYYGADIEITEMKKLFPSTITRNLSSDCSDHCQDESLALALGMMHSSDRDQLQIQNQQQRHFICFVQPTEFLLLISKVPNFISQSWLFLSTSAEGSGNLTTTLLEWSRLLQKLPLNLDSDFFIGIYDRILQQFNVYEFYRICDSSQIQMSLVCTLHSNSVFEGELCGSDKYQRRKNLNGMNVKSIALTAQDFDVNSTKLGTDSWALTGGAYAEVFTTLSTALNFKYELTILEGYQFGKFDRLNRTWDGIIGSVGRGEVDISINPLSITSERLEFVDYSIALTSVGVRIYIQRTLEKNSIHWMFYTSPFSSLLHLTVGICSITLAFSLWGVSKARPLQDVSFTLYETSWVILAALCQKGSHMTPTSPSAKAIFLVAYFTCLIIYCGYSATLTSQLSVPQPLKLPFRDLRGLTYASGWTGGPIKGDFTYNFMQKTCPEILANSGNRSNTQCELLTQAWSRVVAPIEPTLPSNFEAGLRRVLKQERFAFITTETGARNVLSTQLTDQEACSIHEMKAAPLTSNLAFALKKNLKMRKLINYKLLQLHQSGVWSQIRERWLPKIKNCPNSRNGPTDATLFDVAVAPILVLIGLFSSGLLLIVECWWGSSSRSTNSSHPHPHPQSVPTKSHHAGAGAGSISNSNSDSQLQPSRQAMNIGEDFYQTDNKMKWVFH